MTDAQKSKIKALRTKGYGYATIARTLDLKKDTVVAFCRKEGLTGTKAQTNERIHLNGELCRACGSVLLQTPGRKPRKFCSDVCRVMWWNHHPEAVHQKAIYHFTCACCHKPFSAYGNAGRKYCSHACYVSARYKDGVSNA